MRQYANNNPECKACDYRKRFGTNSVVYCDYLCETGQMPKGYLDEEGQWHRVDGPCPEFKPGKAKRYTPEDWCRMLFPRREKENK